METGIAEAEGSSEDIAGKKTSKLKVLRTRLFGRMKRKETEGLMKQSQSASDVTAEESGEGGRDSEDEFQYSHGMLGSRAMSHDSIFLGDEGQASAEPVRVLSKEDVQGRIKALQLKLQQQNLRLGPPPLLIPGKRAEDTGVSSEDDGLPHSPPEISFSLPEDLARGAPKFPGTHKLSSLSLAGTGSEEEEQPPSHPLSPGTRPTRPTAPAALPGVDFDSPARFRPCLDSSAARHRMSVKPRNQRASAKGRRFPKDASRPRSESLNALDRPVLERDEEEEDSKVPKEVVRLRSYSTQVIQSGEAGARRDPMVQKLHLSADGYQLEHTDTDRRDSATPQRLPSDPSKQYGCITVNPLFRRPIPQGLEAPFWMPGLGPNSAELQKPSEAKHPTIVSQPQGSSDLARGVPTEPGPRESLNKVVTPSAVPNPATAGPLSVSENTLTKPPKRIVVRGGALEPVRPQTTVPKTQPLPTPPPPAAPLSTAPRTSSLKRSSTEQEQAQPDCLSPEVSQSATAPPAGSEDQPPPSPLESAKQQRPNSGSFRFSIASAWDRPRGGSLLGREEKRGAKDEVLAGKPEEEAKPKPVKASFVSRREEQVVAIASEEDKPKPQHPNPAAAVKASFVSRREEQVVAIASEDKPKPQHPNPAAAVKASFVSRREEQVVLAASEEAKAREPSRNAVAFQEWTNLNAKGQESTAPWVKPVAMETVGRGAEEGKDSREIRSRGLEEESKGEKDEKSAFGVKLRSTSLSTKYRQREVANPEPKSQSLSVEGCPLGQSCDPQSGPLGQSRDPLGQPRDPQGGPLSQSRHPQGGPLSQSCNPQGGSLGQTRDTQGCPLGQSRDPRRGSLSQSRDPLGDPQALTTTKRPEPLQQHNVAARVSQSLRRENDPEHSCPKPLLQRARTSPNSDPPDPRSAPSSSTRERPEDPKRRDDVDLPTDPSLDTGPASKPASAPPKEAEPVASEPAMSQPAWMTLAREKTRSLQQMFTSRLPREFTSSSPATTAPTPKPAPQPTPQAPPATPQQPRPPAVPPGKGDRAPPGTAERTGVLQGRADRPAQTDKKNEKTTPLAESTAPPADKRPERTDRSFLVGGKAEPKPAPLEPHGTAAAAPHRADVKMEARVTCKVHASETAPSSTPVQSREREDRQPIRTEAPSSAAPAVSSRGQPSWMELAKRKSLAWSDKTMD